MPWSKIDDWFHAHVKVVRAGNAAVGAWVRLLAWSSGNGTDGNLPAGIVRAYASEDEIARLLDVRLLDRDGNDFAIHDFLDWNPSAADVEQTRAARIASGQHGGRRSGEARRNRATRSKSEANASATDEANAQPSDEPIARAKTNPDPDPDPDPDPMVSARAREPPKSISPELAMRDEDRAFAEQLGLRDVELVWSAFVAHYASTGELRADWRAAWRKWCANEVPRQRRERERTRAMQARPGAMVQPPAVGGRSWEVRRRGAEVMKLGDFEIPEPGWRACERCGTQTSRSPCWDCHTREDRITDAKEARVRWLASVPESFRWSTFTAPELAQRVRPPRAIDAARGLLGASRVVLVGPAGHGKTSLAVAMMRAWLATRPDGGGGLFERAKRLATAPLEHPAGHGRSPIVERALRANLLVLDDLGADAPISTSSVPEVIDERHARGLTTWITMGFELDALAQRYGDGIARRISEGAKILRL